ncbi:MAG TPA: DUF4126 domain-containing protein [Edaphobacter sp.]|nr:DUF4126 domain-containing protein [Edaphobacter sp.]
MIFSALVLCFLIGCVAGLRSMTAPAIVCAAAYLRWIHPEGTPLAFMASVAALWVFTICAVGELIVDKLPNTPARTAPMGLIARALTGGLSGATLAASSGKSIAIGAVLGAVGGIAGAFAGYNIRHGIVVHMNMPDIVIAVIEDLLTITGGLFVVARI